MANKRIKDLPADAVPSKTDILAVDSLTTRGVTIENAVKIGRPFASQAQAEAGTDYTTAMNPLTVKQAIAAQGAATFATAAQGVKADSAIQAGDLATVATSGAYADLSGKPTLGTAAATDAAAYATAAQGSTADTAVQPANLGDLALKDKAEVSDIDASGTAGDSTFLRGDGTWSAPAGTGDVAGPSSSIDGRVAVFDGATGKILKDGGKTVAELGTAVGQCILVASAGSLVLRPMDGNRLVINGSLTTIPGAGISLAATGKTPGTLYYIYAYLASGILTLEAVTTGHSQDATTGVQIKTGDATRTLVGWAVPAAGPTWSYSPENQLVRSYFNDAGLIGHNSLKSAVTYGVNDWGELASASRVTFISRGERVDLEIVGVNYCTASGKLYGTSVGIDGLSPQDGPYVDCSPNVSAGLNWTAIGASWPVFVAEGVHYATILGRSYDSASIVWQGGPTIANARCVINVLSGSSSGGTPLTTKRVSGVIQSTAGTWSLITTGNHRAVGVASVSQDSTSITINYDSAGSNVLTSSVSLDETFATTSIIDKVGASVGLSSLGIQLGKVDGSGNTTLVNPSTVSSALGNIWFSVELDA